MDDYAVFQKRWSAMADRQAEELRQQDITKGRCGLVPMPKAANRPFRCLLEIEKLPLFVVSSYRGRSRFMEWDDEANEEPVRRRLLIGKTWDSDRQWGVLQQRHQEVWFGCLACWNDARYPLATNAGRAYGQIVMSARKFVRAIYGHTGGKSYKRLRETLRELASIPITLETVYDSGHVDREEFTLLGQVRWCGRKLDPATGIPSPSGKSVVSILLSDFVTEKFLLRFVKPLLLDAYRRVAGCRISGGVRSEIAGLLYPRLDRALACQDEYHRKLAPLFAELGLRPYKHKSERRRKILPAARALSGEPIQNEQYILQVSLRLSNDETDYVLVARRTGQTSLNL